MQREQKIVSDWNPLKDAKECLENLKRAVNECAADDAMAYEGCTFGNFEAAFYEKQISEDEMISLKTMADDFRRNFTSNCKCTPRKQY